MSSDERMGHTRQTTVVSMDGIAVLHALHHVMKKWRRAEQSCYPVSVAASSTLDPPHWPYRQRRRGVDVVANGWTKPRFIDWMIWVDSNA